MTKQNLSFFILLATIMLSCSKASQEKHLSLIGSKLISDRSQEKSSVVTIIKLKERPFFEVSKDGQVSEEQKNKLIEEQKQALENLQKISKEIKLLYSYKFVMNALAVSTPVKLLGKIEKMNEVKSVRKETVFSRPAYTKAGPIGLKKFDEMTSVRFIKANQLHNELSIKGQDMRVGIIDTGIDYTHAMFGGEGTEEAYKKLDPNTENEFFPSAKIVGGIDLVGSIYNAGAVSLDQKIPRPDSNPLDEGGHGTHVAGTVAGLGDNENTYSGVAPLAKLYAIKVFGKKGGTGEAVIIAALEYAADPNGDLNPDDKLDVVNLSLGGGFGKPHNLYTEAVRNLVNGGVLMVASAGNSGDNSYIVGSPGTAKEAISVAASIDGMEKNWKFKTVGFSDINGESSFAEIVEGPISKPISESQDVKAKLVFAGLAATDFSIELKEKLKGHIALIDRGEVNFVEKLKRAFEAGAVGVILANNKPGSPFAMGGEGSIALPAIMVSQDFGLKVKESMKMGDVIVDFGSLMTLDRPELIDTLTSFSSRGPRSNDSLIKPEITGPGFQIISAAMGSGNKGVAFNGTSMSAPHIAGVMALLKQYRKELSVKELKTILMNTAILMKDKNKNVYPVSLQGAGRVDTYLAATAKIMVGPYSLSLGETSLLSSKKLKRTITLKNFSDKGIVLQTKVRKEEGLYVEIAETIKLSKGEEKKIDVYFKLKESKDKKAISERDTYISFLNEDKVIAKIPVLVVVKNLSRISASNFNISSTDFLDSEGALVSIDLKNSSKNSGDAFFFNLLGEDERKPIARNFLLTKSRSCDLEKAGYRIHKKENKTFIQFGVKIFGPVSRWQACEVSIQLDTNNDQIADQEIGGINYRNLEGLSRGVAPGYYSLLLDAPKARKLRFDYEQAVLSGADNAPPSPNFLEAVLDMNAMTTYSHSTISIINIDLSKINLPENGPLKIKLGVLHQDRDAIQSDDFLGELENEWLLLSLVEDEQSFLDLPGLVSLKGGEKKTLSFLKGAGSYELMILAPMNLTKGERSLSADHQSLRVLPAFLP